MKDYKELLVWQRAVSLATQIYRMTSAFPSAEKFGLTAQIRRAVTSVPANIAEGWAIGSTKEYIQFLFIARGSLSELETHLVVSRNLGFLQTSHLSNAQTEIEQIGKMLNGLIQSLRAR